MSLDPARRAVLIDIAYEIGGAGLAKFVNMLAAIRAEQWQVAADELRHSLLYEQVPARERENIAILIGGQLPAGIATAAELVRHHEGCVLTAKPDAKGKWAYGYGHDIPAPVPGDPTPCCTQVQADTWFVEDFALATQRAAVDLGAAYW